MQAEDGIRYAQESRGLGDVYKRQAINDAAIAAFSRYLAVRYPSHGRASEFAANATWFTARAARFALMFDEETGFFRGRDRSGRWRPGAFDPRDWGTDYTETNAWGTRFTACLLYTSDAADDLLCVDLGGRRSIKNIVIHDDPDEPNPYRTITRPAHVYLYT